MIWYLVHLNRYVNIYASSPLKDLARYQKKSMLEVVVMHDIKGVKL